jgi:predicted TPR repeat methyltransferase
VDGVSKLKLEVHSARQIPQKFKVQALYDQYHREFEQMLH